MTVALWASYVLAACFFAGGIVNFIGPKVFMDEYKRWGYPSWWNYVTGTLEVGAAILAVIPQTRVIGLGLGVFVCVAAFATVMRFREYNHVAPSAILGLLTIADALFIASVAA